MAELKPLEQFYCDACGNLIESVPHGYVVYNTTDDGLDHDFQIIHQSKCDDRSRSKSLDLASFLGVEGLVQLTSMLTPGPIIMETQKPEYVGTVQSFDEYVDFFRRLQIPYYEEARRRFSAPAVVQEHFDSNELYPYLPKILKHIAEMDLET